MSTREKNKKVQWMNDYEAQMMARGLKPSKTWFAAKESIGSITVNDPAYML